MSIEQLGPYKIEKKLGQGGMGTVYTGVNEETGEKAAIKVLSPSLAENASFRVRFEAEVDMLKTLSHPNIVQLYGYGHEGQIMFYAMELVEGVCLQEELHKGRRFTWREATDIGIQICQSLKHAHDHGVIHRDLKPANLLLDPDNNVKLLDFGIAKLFGAAQVTAAGGVLGTADYMAPEQAEGKPATARSDLYSLGGVLYALLTGRPPFLANSIAEIIHSLRFDIPAPVRSLAPLVPIELESIIKQLLEKNPQDRIATTLALGNRLRGLQFTLREQSEQDLLSSEQTVVDPKAPPLKSPDNRKTSAENSTSLRPTVAASQVSNRNDLHLPTKMPGATVEAKTEVQQGPSQSVFETESRFTTVEDEPKKTIHDYHQLDNTPWIMILGVGVAILAIGLVGWKFTQPPSAADLYQSIITASEKDIAALAESEKDIESFLALFPESPHHEEVAAFQEEIDLYRMERKFQRRIRRIGDPADLSPVENAYLEASRLTAINPETATLMLGALIDVFGQEDSSDSHQQQCVELARRRLESLHSSLNQPKNETVALLEKRLEHATSLYSSDPASAEAIYRGLIVLYADKPWAAEIVLRAQKALEQIEKGEQAP